jgi:hypothetical protein
MLNGLTTNNIEWHEYFLSCMVLDLVGVNIYFTLQVVTSTFLEQWNCMVQTNAVPSRSLFQGKYQNLSYELSHPSSTSGENRSGDIWFWCRSYLDSDLILFTWICRPNAPPSFLIQAWDQSLQVIYRHITTCIHNFTCMFHFTATFQRSFTTCSFL